MTKLADNGFEIRRIRRRIRIVWQGESSDYIQNQ